MEKEFAGTEYENIIDCIMEILESTKTHKLLYLNMLKQFGKKDGLEIYHRVRRIV